jgi:hypothetical protein
MNDMKYTPIRKITNTRSRKNTGFFPSQKNERPVAFESLLERDYIYILEFDSDVLSYEEQPLTIKYYFNNKMYKYTPDFLVRRKNKNQLVEIKPHSKLQKILDDDFMVKKYNAAAQFCKANGYSEFKIITDEEIRSGNILENVKFLFSYSKLDIPASEKMKIRNALILNGSQQIFQLLSEICEDERNISKYYSYILSMLYKQEIKTDFLNPIAKTSFIRM